MILNGSQLAKRIGVSRQAISKFCSEGLLRKNKDGKIDTEDSFNSYYIRSKGLSPKTMESNPVAEESILKIEKSKIIKQSLPKIQKAKQITENVSDDSNNLEYFINTSELSSGDEATRLLNQKFSAVLKEFGTIKKVKEYVEILYKLSQVEKNQMATDAVRNVLVNQDDVEKKVFQYLEMMNIALLEYPASVAEIEISMAQSSAEKARIEIPEMHKKNISKIISECKRSVKRELKDMIKEVDFSGQTEC